MKREKNRFAKIKLLAAIVIVLAGIVFIIFTNNGLADYFRLKGEVEELHHEIKSAKMQLEELRNEIDSLKSSKAKIERVAREEYMMKNKNEEAFRVEEK